MGALLIAAHDHRLCLRSEQAARKQGTGVGLESRGEVGRLPHTRPIIHNTPSLPAQGSMSYSACYHHLSYFRFAVDSRAMTAGYGWYA